ncbi:monocarboxylate transporter 12-like [Petromyzon marinus]|uniref:Monocarboxylate transporter 12-like n=1 Tax=Petromyzon marinus TaxID=7757 RepID=A0AAJ7TKB3_PETMA|nr:monocarboxylate transporter 12-like [Petromyzon marinus]XP_032818970.1 monocarboxylate transporter 12-like [Petromyzon marinus]XP_032818972.1 monocarboxylate transporter 12-like [Petromyzon marinus]
MRGRGSVLPQPPDGGWGWMVVLACFIVNVCTRAVTRCISIFFMEFQSHFQKDYATTAWINSMVDCLTMLCAPIGSLLSSHFGCRATVMAGGLFSSAGFIMASFATSIEMLYVFLGVFAGFGFSLCYSPSIVMVTKYFRRRRALATGLAMSGSGVGTFLLAPLVQYLLDVFSWRGALLLLGAFVSNLCVCGALLRPIHLQAELEPSVGNGNNGTDARAVPPVFRTDPGMEAWTVAMAGPPDRGCSAGAGACARGAWGRLVNAAGKLRRNYGFVVQREFVVFWASVMLMAYGCSTPFVYLVPYAQSHGVPPGMAALLLSVLGIVDIAGNISYGWLTDRPSVRKHRGLFYMVAVGLEGVWSLLLPLMASFPLLMVYAVLYGYFDGAYVTLISVVTADLVGPVHVSSAVGLVFFMHAVPYLIAPPVAGWLVDITGTYTAAFLVSGMAMILSALLFGVVSCFRSYCAKREPKEPMAESTAMVRNDTFSSDKSGVTVSPPFHVSC